MTRIASVDIGTNSTRLLIADVENGHLTEIERATQVTRLGEGVDATGRLAEEAIDRVLATLDGYRELITDSGVERTTGVLTSAVRDAANGAELLAAVRDGYAIDARTIGGDEEAELTFLGATSERRERGPWPVLVIDIGGGSTELVAGTAAGPYAHSSVQAGVVRQSERHLRSDPPRHDELERLAADARALIAPVAAEQSRAAGDGGHGRPRAAIAVAGTPTSLAAIDQELDPYDPNRVHGYVLERGECELLLARLAGMPLAERRDVAGLHPDRAPTIVAGTVILLEVMDAFELESVEASERDVLHGAALRAAGAG